MKHINKFMSYGWCSIKGNYIPNGECVTLADHESELTAVTEQRDQWKDKYFQQWNGTIWSECKRLQTELDVVTEQRDGLKQAVDCANDLLASVTEQRDAVTLRLGRTQEKMFDAERQRDRLAVALRELWKNHTLHGAAYELIEQALAAVKGGSHE
jgi:predicted  nucleic acid-binding Zn-ribbon protein